MEGIANAAEAGLLSWSLAFAAGVTILVAAGSWRSGLRSMLMRGVLTALIFALIGTGLYQWRLAEIRSAIAASDCNKFSAPDRQYVLELCYAGDMNVIRLWSADQSSLLAERTFPDLTHEPMRTYWGKGKLEYESDNRYELEVIKLPPTLKDRLLARLP
ncbi:MULTISPECIES: hypothetical protein [unclassified Caballeronia]|uniref:hypothetical protein n=1 Tax=unclassified Caballeronia TaxID=2646786 RepID=UPI002856CC99|nr:MULTISPECIES: hypothetical protein [unclassified Caballeronia]MDR5740533.1 hypothetical protein [Caballeronia sp. LZ016]MDR5808946.1 hypothetical protein [Caballeronia sp. LZ019]